MADINNLWKAKVQVPALLLEQHQPYQALAPENIARLRMAGRGTWK